jgi:hypothetical protein
MTGRCCRVVKLSIEGDDRGRGNIKTPDDLRRLFAVLSGTRDEHYRSIGRASAARATLQRGLFVYLHALGERAKDRNRILGADAVNWLTRGPAVGGIGLPRRIPPQR